MAIDCGGVSLKLKQYSSLMYVLCSVVLIVCSWYGIIH